MGVTGGGEDNAGEMDSEGDQETRSLAAAVGGQAGPEDSTEETCSRSEERRQAGPTGEARTDSR